MHSLGGPQRAVAPLLGSARDTSHRRRLPVDGQDPVERRALPDTTHFTGYGRDLPDPIKRRSADDGSAHQAYRDTTACCCRVICPISSARVGRSA